MEAARGNKRERFILSYSNCDDSDASSHIYFKRHFFEEDEEHEETIVLAGNQKMGTKGKIGVVIDDKHVGTILGEMKVKDLVPNFNFNFLFATLVKCKYIELLQLLILQENNQRNW
uniref:Uncharacterized protein n=1 Tax=Glossina pallidipes TaxID=7398 RepID=A0A1A9ZSQ4_GLOPL